MVLETLWASPCKELTLYQLTLGTTPHTTPINSEGSVEVSGRKNGHWEAERHGSGC